MQPYEFSPALSKPLDGRLSAAVIARRVLQGVGGGACVLLSAAMPWADFSETGITLGSVHLPMLFVALVGVTVVVGLAFFAASVWGLVKRLRPITRSGVFFIAALTVLSAAGFEYGYLRQDRLVLYEYRAAARMLGYMTGIALLACSVPEELGPRIAILIRRLQLGWRHVLAMAFAATAAAALISTLALDGMPHFLEGASYTLQAKMLWAGQLAADVPMHPELFDSELVYFTAGEAGYYSNTPVGWPAVLGLFESLGVPWLANALLAGLLVVLTYKTVAVRGGKRLAGISAAIVAGCPWLWMNGATMTPHLASAVWLWLFLWLFMRAVKASCRRYAMLAGLSLGAAVVTRPIDAALFALPCIFASIVWMIRMPDRWLSRLPMVVLGVTPGLIAHFWIGTALPGGAQQSASIFEQAPGGLLQAVAWLHEGWVGMSSGWFAGAAPVAMLILCGIVFGRPVLRGQWPVLFCSASFFLCYALFVFAGRSWVGPRWYVPLIPAAAMLIAAGLVAASRAGRVRSPAGVLAAGHLRASLVAAVVVFGLVVPVRIAELIDRPPHGVDGRVVRAVNAAGLSHAVVALPEQPTDPQTGRPHHKRGIAGMWSMQIPFEASGVVYVTAVEGWEQMSADAWPGRTLYEMTAAEDDFTPYPAQAKP